MEFFLEFVLEIYLGFAEILIPDRKFKKWQETLLKLASIFVCLVTLGCLAAGISILADGANKTAGIILSSVGGAFLLVQTTMFLTVLVHDIITGKVRKNNSNGANNSIGENNSNGGNVKVDGDNQP